MTTLRTELNNYIKKNKVLKNGFRFYLLIMVINGVTSGFLGMPDINSIASFDGISNINNGFSVLERSFMLLTTTVMMLPFFGQIYYSKITDKKNASFYSIVSNSRKDKIAKKKESVVAKIASSYLLKALKLYSATNVTIIGILLLTTIFATLGGGAVLATLAILVPTLIALSLIKSILQSATVLLYKGKLLSSLKDSLGITRALTNDQDEIKRSTVELFLRKSKSNFKSRKIVENAVTQLTSIKNITTDDNSLKNTLKHMLYQEQLQRARSLYLNPSQSIDLSSIKLANILPDGSDKAHFLKEIATSVDQQLEKSPLLGLDKMSKDFDKEKAKKILQTIHIFRKLIMSGHIDLAALKEKNINIGQTKDIVLDNDINKKLGLAEADDNSDVLNAVKAEIAEEIYLEKYANTNGIYYKDNHELQQKLQQGRFSIRTALELEKYINKYESSAAKSFYKTIASYLGFSNAIVNGMLTSAVTSVILQGILPYIIGISITNPIIILGIMLLTFIAGFMSSFIMTKPSMEKIGDSKDKDIIKSTIIANDNKMTAYETAVTAIVAFAAIGLSMLSSLKVYSLLIGVFSPMAAVIASIIIFIIGFIAISSLFQDNMNKSLLGSIRKKEFLQLYFPDENIKQEKLAKKHINEIILSGAIGISCSLMIWNILPQIVFAATLGIFAALLTNIIMIALTSNYYKSNNAIFNQAQERAAILVTFLYNGCLFISITSGIIAIIGSSPLAISLAMFIAAGVAILYSNFMWQSATNPSLLQEPLVDDSNNRQKDISKNNIIFNTFGYSAIFATALVTILLSVAPMIPLVPLCVIAVSSSLMYGFYVYSIHADVNDITQARIFVQDEDRQYKASEDIDKNISKKEPKEQPKIWQCISICLSFDK